MTNKRGFNVACRELIPRKRLRSKTGVISFFFQISPQGSCFVPFEENELWIAQPLLIDSQILNPLRHCSCVGWVGCGNRLTWWERASDEREMPDKSIIQHCIWKLPTSPSARPRTKRRCRSWSELKPDCVGRARRCRPKRRTSGSLEAQMVTRQRPGWHCLGMTSKILIIFTVLCDSWQKSQSKE